MGQVRSALRDSPSQLNNVGGFMRRHAAGQSITPPTERKERFHPSSYVHT